MRNALIVVGTLIAISGLAVSMYAQQPPGKPAPFVQKFDPCSPELKKSATAAPQYIKSTVRVVECGWRGCGDDFNPDNYCKQFNPASCAGSGGPTASSYVISCDSYEDVRMPSP